MRSEKNRIERLGRAALAVAILSYLPTSSLWAQSAPSPDVRSAYNISAGSLAAALDQFSQQGGIQTLSKVEQLAGKQVGALSGQMTWREALGRLLKGSGLEYQQINATTVVIRPTGASPQSKSHPVAPIPTKPVADSKPQVTDIQGVTVTGTRIRGGTTPSPVITIGAENIREEGFSDLGEVIRSVPQNFTGGQNPGVSSLNFSGGGIQNQNLTGGSSLNLRGLGPDASLTLLNGRRLAYGGFSQTVDISAIPVEAVERIEIVADGASAIYGSDAVGGVGNVILRRDFEGVTVGTRYGAATDGGLVTREYTATAGTTWSTGGLMATYKDMSVDPIYARERDYTDYLVDPTTIYPGSKQHGGLASIHQSLGDAVELRLDAFRNKRDQFYNIFYNGLSQVRSSTTTSFASPSIEFTLPNEWTLFIAGAWGKDKYIHVQSKKDLQTNVSRLLINDCYCNGTRSFEFGGEGRLFALDGGDARLAFGAGYRRNEYEQFNHLKNISSIHGAESSRFAYGEINLPLLGSDKAGTAPERLAVTAAVRSEDYDSRGRVTTPKLGLIYNPIADMTLKASWGKSFKMPTLYQRYRARIVGLRYPAEFGGTGFAPDATILTLSGGAPDLKPEKARTWSTSLAFHPQALPGLDMELTWFDVDYTDRVVEPITNPSVAMSSPIFAQFIHSAPSPEEMARLTSIGSIVNYTTRPYDPTKVVAILYNNYVNTSSQRIQGLDLTGSYSFDVGGGKLMLRGSTSWLDSSQKTSTADRTHALSGTLFNPAKINGRFGAVWTQSNLSFSLFGNYTEGVTDTINHKQGASLTTFDAALHYSTGERRSVWSGVELVLSARNILDRAPPSFTPSLPLYMVPYDSTNYSPIGRFLSMSVSKHW